MRYLLGILTAILLPAVAAAQDIKRAPLADYVAFCLNLWDGGPDVSAKAAALGLQDAAGAGNSGASITIEKSTLRFFKPVQGSGGTVGVDLDEDGGRQGIVVRYQPDIRQRTR